MNKPPPDPMVPILTGWLAGCIAKDAGRYMKLSGVEILPPAAFAVTFASGLTLRVSVEEVPQIAEAKP